MPKLLAVGVGLVDVYASECRMYPGGNELNVAWYARELGAESSFMGVLGSDQAGKLLARLCREKGIDLTRSRFERGQSNFALVELIKGERIFTGISKNGVTDLYPVRCGPEDLAYAACHDLICASYASRLRREDLAALAGTKIPLCYDFNDDFTEEEMKELCPLASFGLFSCGHCETGEAARAVLRRACSLGCGTAVATLGAGGSLVLAGGQFYTEPALPVQAVDTMGAGDSFWAAFLVNWFKNVQTHGAPDVQGAMRAASAFAGKNVCRRGSLGFGMPVDLAALGEIRPL